MVSASCQSSLINVPVCKMSSKNYMPPEYAPAHCDVVIGRGKKWLHHRGNEKLRELVTSKLDEYSAATTKNEKSKILSFIVSCIRTSDPEEKGSFVKFDPEVERWFDVGDFLARERVSQAFRDALHSSYRSSNEYKKKRKREQNYKASLTRKYLRAEASAEATSGEAASVETPAECTSDSSKSRRITSQYSDFATMFDFEVTSNFETMNIASGIACSLPPSYSLAQWFEDSDDNEEATSDEEMKTTKTTENFDFIHTLNDCIGGMKCPQRIEIELPVSSEMKGKVSENSPSSLCFKALPPRNVASARTA